MTPTERLLAWWPSVSLDPLGRPYLLCSVDVQQGWFRAIYRAWNKASKSRLVHAATHTTPGQIKDTCDALGVIPERTVLDVRYNRQWVRRLAGQYGWRTMEGENEKDYRHPDGIRRIFSEPIPLDPFQGTIHQGRCSIRETKFAKWACLDRLDILRTLTANDGDKLFTAADDAPAWYFKEMEAYIRIPKKSQNGETFHEWQVSGPDHTPDAECMGIAVASALGLTGAESMTTAPTPPDPAAPATELRAES